MCGNKSDVVWHSSLYWPSVSAATAATVTTVCSRADKGHAKSDKGVGEWSGRPQIDPK